ncbi:YncE family protein [Rhodobacteraceae bacterium M382]|nr:YncE family protein [Rhodobacteraceae bacterium M382]
MITHNLGNLFGGVTFAALVVGAASAETVFIPEGSADSMLIVDAATGTTIRRIEGLEAVHGLSGAPGVPVLVAGSYTEIERTKITEIEQPIGVSADDHAAHHAAAPKRLGPADAGLSLLSILDATSGEILRQIEVPGAVHHTAVSPNGRFAIATHPSGDGISVVDLVDFELVAFVVTGSMPNYAVFGADPDIVYVTNTGNGTISEVDLTRGIVRRNLIAGEAPEHMVADPDAGVLYVADADVGQVLELDLTDETARRSFDIGGEIHGLGLSDDRTRLFVAGRGENKLAAIDLDSGSVTTVALTPEPYHLTTIPGTGRFFVSSRAEPMVWIVEDINLSVTGEFPVNGEGHQMVATQ